MIKNRSVTNRDQSIDIMKGVATILVVLGHAIQLTLGDARMDYSLLFRIIYSFHMPFFMFLSGYLYGKYGKVFDYKWLYRRFCGLAIPFWAWAVILWWLREANAGDLSLLERLGRLLLDPSDNGLWFLTALFWCCVMTSASWYIARIFGGLLKGINRKKTVGIMPIHAMLLILLIIMFCYFRYIKVLNMPYRLSCQTNIYFGIAFLLGKIDFLNRLKAMNRKLYVLIFCLVFITYSLCMTRWQRNMNIQMLFSSYPGMFKQLLYFAFVVGVPILGIYLAVCVCILLDEYANVSIKSVLGYLGENSLAIYAMQWLFLSALVGGYWLTIIAKTLTGLVMPVFISEHLLKRIKFTRILFLGGR